LLRVAKPVLIAQQIYPGKDIRASPRA